MRATAQTLLSHRTGRAIRESNISAWRRTVCGDLSSLFRPYHGEKLELPKSVERDAFLESIHQAQFRQLPDGYRRLLAKNILLARSNPLAAPWMPHQEEGTRPASALPYELAVDGSLSADRKALVLQFAAGREVFGERAAGAPFQVFSLGSDRAASGTDRRETVCIRNYAVSAGDRVSDSWSLTDFAEARYHLRMNGPNGFFREFQGGATDPGLEVTLEPAREGATPTGDGMLRLTNRDSQERMVGVEDLSYGQTALEVTLPGEGHSVALTLKLGGGRGWYDFRLGVAGAPEFGRRYAGRIETGRDSISDSRMGRVPA